MLAAAPAPATTPALARAFLALADADEPPPDQRPVATVLAAVLSAVVLACAAPLGWTVRAHGKSPAPPVAISSRAAAHGDD
jgi:hypothetical protein